jgi:integrase
MPLSVEQVAALAEAMPERYRTMVLAQASLGLRIGELLALRVEDVDSLRPHRADRVAVHPRVERGAKRAEDSPVEADRPAAPGGRRRTGSSPGGVSGGRRRNNLHHREGHPLGHVYYGHNLIRRAVDEAGLPKGTTSHDLRHHYASVLLAAGESVVAVAERLGHEDASLVLGTHGHLMPDSDDRTRSAIDAAWDSASALCAPDVPQDAQSLR